MDLRKTYDAIMELQRDLQRREGAQALADFTHPCKYGVLLDYRTTKALVATYELQEYLANAIAEAVEAGELEPDLEG